MDGIWLVAGYASRSDASQAARCYREVLHRPKDKIGCVTLDGEVVLVISWPGLFWTRETNAREQRIGSDIAGVLGKPAMFSHDLALAELEVGAYTFEEGLAEREIRVYPPVVSPEASAVGD